jgi:chloride channel protein, CIC family
MPEQSPPERGAAPAPRRPFYALLADTSPLDLRLIGRTLLHAAIIGVVAGVMAVIFFGALELLEELVLGGLAGYTPLRADGEKVFSHLVEDPTVRMWLLPIIPAVGALAGGILTAKIAPEAAGGGGNAMITAFHHQGGMMRKRVAWVKALASILTLGTGGAGGREGPTMQIGGALGSLVARWLKVSRREARILMLTGVAAGMSAVFRTPLGAALLATEVLYRDDFESDALIPALLASVVSYSIFISVYGESTLFAHAAHFPFFPAHLPLYALFSILLSLLAIVFLNTLSGVKKLSLRLPGPAWMRPGVGGLALGIFCTGVLWFVDRKLNTPGQGIGLLGSGYGAVQVAITGAPWLPSGWTAVELLLLLCGAKLVAASLTLGSGGSAGDFAPSLVLGGLFGGAFGRAAQLLLHDPRIDPGAFALVGMGTFYGGIAHAPISSLVMVCELAGSYDLLVPMMLAEGIAFVALRNRSLYSAQVPTKRESPAHRVPMADILRTLLVRDALIQGRSFTSFTPATRASDMLHQVADTAWQDVFPVLDPAGKMLGIITSESLRVIASERELEGMTVAADIAQPGVSLAPDDDLRTAVESMQSNTLREIPVIDATGGIIGLLDEADISRAYLVATAKLQGPADATPFSSR